MSYWPASPKREQMLLLDICNMINRMDPSQKTAFAIAMARKVGKKLGISQLADLVNRVCAARVPSAVDNVRVTAHCFGVNSEHASDFDEWHRDNHRGYRIFYFACIPRTPRCGMVVSSASDDDKIRAVLSKVFVNRNSAVVLPAVSSPGINLTEHERRTLQEYADSYLERDDVKAILDSEFVHSMDTGLGENGSQTALFHRGPHKHELGSTTRLVVEITEPEDARGWFAKFRRTFRVAGHPSQGSPPSPFL